MKNPLRILHLEDDPNDATLVQANLENNGIACRSTRVQKRTDFLDALEAKQVDLVLADFSLPEFNGMAALEVVRQKWPSIPFIIVSGTMGEEKAIDSLKMGATDYVLKERLSRLVPAVRRAMKEVEDRIERERIQAQFVEAQKMEVIGQLATGVAHDFNNMLAVIMGSNDLISANLGANSPELKYTEEIRHAAQCAAGLTRQLLVFSRHQAVQTTVLDVNEVVQDLDKMLRRLIEENIEMTMVPEKDIGRIQADPGHIRQVIMNLVVNARDAMPAGGKLTITTRNIRLSTSKETSLVAIPPGDYVLLQITDTGTGMTHEVKSRLFETFFTTKAKGKGTGLGLPTCQTIVQQSGGGIEVESEVGNGTTFNVYFPRVDQPVETAAKPVKAGAAPRGTETLLVVEDDPAVRKLTCLVLETLGYTVLQADNGQEALRVVDSHTGSPISLVITDVNMPIMGGKVMAEWLRTANTDLKILFTSGYTDEPITREGALDESLGDGIDFLGKPFTLPTLSRKVREMLDARAAPIGAEF